MVRRQRAAVPHPEQRDITVDYKNGKVVLKEKCFAIAAVDQELAQTRVWEKKFKLNTGEVVERPVDDQGAPEAPMHSVVAFAVFGVDWEFFKPYIVLGLALGGVYALSGVGIVVLYQATGVLNLAFGAIGAAGALIAYWIDQPHELAATGSRTSPASRSAGSSTSLYGRGASAPPSRARDPLVKMMGTLGLALILLGLMAWRAPAGGAFVRVLPLPTLEPHATSSFGAFVNLDADHRARVRGRAHRRDDARSCATRSSAPRTGRSPTTARSPPRSACPCAASRPSAWFGSGLVCGAAGLLLADLFTSLDYTALTFLVISSLAAALIGRLQSLWVTLLRRARGRPRPGRRSTPYASVDAQYRTTTPFVLAIIALLWLSRRRVVTISRTAR